MTEDHHSEGWKLLEWLLVLTALAMLTLTLWSLAGNTISATVNDILNPPTPIPARPTRSPSGWRIAPDLVAGINGIAWDDSTGVTGYGWKRSL